MNNKFNPLWIVVGLVAFLLLVVGIGYISGNNSGARQEAGIMAADQNSRNVLGQYAPKLREALGVTKLQAKAVEDIITGANESRYGKTGSAATVQWIQEQNSSLDQSNYGRIIDIVNGGRTDFANAQQEKIDKIRVYRTSLGTFPSGTFMKMAGYPTPGFFDKYDKIVISQHASDAFNTGIDNGVDMNNM